MSILENLIGNFFIFWINNRISFNLLTLNFARLNKVWSILIIIKFEYYFIEFIFDSKFISKCRFTTIA